MVATVGMTGGLVAGGEVVVMVVMVGVGGEVKNPSPIDMLKLPSNSKNGRLGLVLFDEDLLLLDEDVLEPLEDDLEDLPLLEDFLEHFAACWWWW